MSAIPCSHLDSIEIENLPEEVAGCEECLETGGQWCHLRICLTCGHVGCCDSSPNRHASAHARATDHPLMRSIQPGEDWGWCFVDRATLPTVPLSGDPRIPRSPLCP